MRQALCPRPVIWDVYDGAPPLSLVHFHLFFFLCIIPFRVSGDCFKQGVGGEWLNWLARPARGYRERSHDRHLALLFFLSFYPFFSTAAVDMPYLTTFRMKCI